MRQPRGQPAPVPWTLPRAWRTTYPGRLIRHWLMRDGASDQSAQDTSQATSDQVGQTRGAFGLALAGWALGTGLGALGLMVKHGHGALSWPCLGRSSSVVSTTPSDIGGGLLSSQGSSVT